jgi:hypothetical protein
MKKFAFIFAALVVQSAYSISPAEKQISCSAIGTTYLMAAGDRDAGRSPEQAYQIIAGGFLHAGATPVAGINKESIKKAINAVYFDPAFTNAGGQRLADQVMNDCMRDGKPQFQPLK